MAYFHFFIIERQMSWWEEIHVANFLQKLPYRKSAIHFLTMAILRCGNILWDQMRDYLNNWDLPWKGMGGTLLQSQVLTNHGLHVKPAQRQFQTLKRVGKNFKIFCFHTYTVAMTQERVVRLPLVSSGKINTWKLRPIGKPASKRDFQNMAFRHWIFEHYPTIVFVSSENWN